MDYLTLSLALFSIRYLHSYQTYFTDDLRTISILIDYPVSTYSSFSNEK